MAVEVITRSNTVTLAFTFLDVDGNAATISSATAQMEYAGRGTRETETLTLSDNGDGTWGTTWDSSKARRGWVHVHAHAIDSSANDLTEDTRFKMSANRANYQHDTLPGGSLDDYDYTIGD